MQAQALVLLPVVAARSIQLIKSSSPVGATYLLACCGLCCWAENGLQILLLALLGLGRTAPTTEDVMQTLYANVAGSRGWPLIFSAPFVLTGRQGGAVFCLTAACLLSKSLLHFQSATMHTAFFCWITLTQEQDLSDYPMSTYVILSRALFYSATCLVVALGLSVQVLKSRVARERLMCAATVLAALITLSAPYGTPDGSAGGNLFAFTLDRLLHHKLLVVYELSLVPASLFLGITKALSSPQDPNCEISTMKPAEKKPYILGRKYFHLVTALVALPQALSDPGFMCAAWAVSLLAYAFLEGSRVIDLGGVASAVNARILSLTDKRDREGLILTPFFLGLGTCVTLWIETFRRGTSFSIYRASIGLVATCVADGAAGIAGTFSPTKWRLYGSGDNGKTVQGTAAFIVSYVLFSLVVLAALAAWQSPCWRQVVPGIVVAAIVSGLVEGYTKSIDNFFVALVAYLTHCTVCG